MKRSEINSAIDSAIAFFNKMNFPLPPYAFFSPKEWKRKHSDYQEVIDCKLGCFAGYNGGHSTIDWDPNTWPDETKRYVYWGTGIMNDIAQGLDESPRLQEWMEAGGYSLCNQAQIVLNLP